MPSYGKTEDGVPWVAIGSNEPESKEFIVHTECAACGKVKHFDLWAMVRGDEIVCEHCGYKSRATKQVWTGDGWEDV